MKKFIIKHFRDISFKHKLTLIILISCCIALLLAFTNSIIYEFITLRAATVDDLSTLAEIISSNTTAALLFNDSTAGEEILSALRNERYIKSACIYKEGGRIFACYRRDPLHSDFLPYDSGGEEGYHFENEYLFIFHRIIFEGEVLGKIIIKYDMQKMQSRLVRYITIAFTMLVISIVIALLFSRKLQRVITEPIANLAGVVNTISKNKDYSIRVEEDESKDEIGTLIIGFNEMLAKIQERDTDLGSLMEEQRNMKEYLDNIIDSTLDCVIVTDEEGYLTKVNKYFLDLTKYQEEEVVGRHMSNFEPQKNMIYESTTGESISIDKKLHDSTKERMSKLAHNGKLLNWEFFLVDKDKKIIPVEENIVYLYNLQGRIIGTVSILRDITERKKAEKKLSEYQNQLRSLASKLTFAEEKERQRIATNLHDRIGQALAISKIKLAMLQKSSPSDVLAKSLSEVYSFISQAIRDTRSLVMELRPPALYQLGFEKAIEGLVKDFQERGNIQIEYEDDGQNKPLSEDTRVLLYNALGELLMNVIKHAKAHKVKVYIKKEETYIKSVVKDDGIGFDTPDIDSHKFSKGCYGLFSIRERLSYIGGQLTIESVAGRGACVTLLAPLKGYETL